MIKRIVGVIVALAVVAVIVLTVMRFGEYRSMLAQEPGPTNSERVAP